MIKVLTYNLETVLAEKLETILTRGEKNSRMKDFYDVYLIMALKKDELNLKHLEQAVYNTFKKRNFTSDVENILTSISDSKILKIKWVSYTRRKHIQDISYSDTISCLEELMLLIDIKLVV